MKYLKLISIFILIFILYSIPGFFLNDSEFYLSLNKPYWAFKPQTFMIVWITLFVINSLYLTYKIYKKSLNIELKASFIMNYIVMFLFDLYFFKFNHLFLSFSLSIFSFTSGLLIFIFLLKENRYEASIITPYLLWTLLASILIGHMYFIN